MASNKNSNNAGSPGNDAVGFRTATFGFDKNDVTMYIASLRKKMKAMEEEYENKLTQALNNPAVSSDTLKHEREVIRAELEKEWNNKLLERTSTIKNQQEQIDILERQLAESNASVESLKAQLSAATYTSGSNAGFAADDKAAQAYMRFTAELRSISDSAQRTLASIEQIWSDEFGIYDAIHDIEPVAPESVQAEMPVSAEMNKNVGISDDSGFGSLIANGEEDSFASLITDINGNSVMQTPLISEPEPAPVPKPAPTTAEISDDFASLLADGDDDSVAKGADIFEVTPAAVNMGNDIDADMLSDIVIAPGEEHNGDDLGKMLKEKEESEFDALKDLFVSESAPEVATGNFYEISVTPIAEADYKPGISTEFDLKVDDNTDMKGLEDFLAVNDEAVKEVKVQAVPESADKNKEEDLFDFSFLIADDDEDDMSSNVSDF